MERLSHYLASNLSSLRQARNLTQSKLAELTGVPRSTIGHIESGSGNPSLHNLARIAQALQVSVEELIAQPRGEYALVRAADIPSEKRSGGAFELFKLLPDPIPGMEIDRMELAPGCKAPGKPHLANTREYLTCVRGQVTVHVDGDTVVVEQGDVLAFPGRQPHGYENRGDTHATCVSVVVLIHHDHRLGRDHNKESLL